MDGSFGYGMTGKEKWPRIAAVCLAGINGTPALIDADLYQYLAIVARMIENAGGELVSRQVIAVAIQDWVARNRDLTPYHFGG